MHFLVSIFTLELMTLFVNRVFKISALWFISQIHENANLRTDGKTRNQNLGGIRLGRNSPTLK